MRTAFNSYWMEPDIAKESNGILVDVLRSRLSRTSIGKYEHVELQYYNLMLKRVTTEISNLLISGSDSINSWYALTGLSLVDVFHMPVGQWHSILNMIKLSKAIADKARDDKLAELESKEKQQKKNMGGVENGMWFG